MLSQKKLHKFLLYSGACLLIIVLFGAARMQAQASQRPDLIAEGKQIPDGCLVLGSPGKVVRQLTEDEIRRFSGIAGNYVKRWQRYKTDLKPDLS